MPNDAPLDMGASMTDIQTRWNNLEGTPEDRHLALLMEGWNAEAVAKVRAEMEADTSPMNKRQAQ